MFPAFKNPQKTAHHQDIETAINIQKLCFPYVEELIKDLDGKYIGQYQKPIKTTWEYCDWDFIRATLSIQYPPYGVMVREITHGSRIHFRCINPENLSIENIEFGFVKYWDTDTDYKEFWARYRKMSEFDLGQIVARINERIEEMIMMKDSDLRICNGTQTE